MAKAQGSDASPPAGRGPRNTERGRCGYPSILLLHLKEAHLTWNLASYFLERMFWVNFFSFKRQKNTVEKVWRPRASIPATLNFVLF